MTYLEMTRALRDLSLDDLVRLNRDCVRTIKAKRSAQSTLAMTELQIGDHVRVNLGPRSENRYNGQTGVVTKFGRTNVTIRLDLAPLGSIGLLRVHAAYLVKTSVAAMIAFGHDNQPERAARFQA